MQEKYNHQHNTVEIDLGELIVAIWKGKWLITGVTAACLAIAIVYLVFVPRTYSTQVEIRPITSFQAEAYTYLNRLEFFEVDRRDLLESFGERLATKEDLAQAIIDHNLVDRSQFDNNEDYAEKVRDFANAITLEGPGVSGDDSDRRSILVRLEGPSQLATATAFNEAFSNINEFVRANLESRFNLNVETETRIRDSQLEDLDSQTEDLRVGYELDADRRLAFLAEQAQIARQLNLAKPAIEGQTARSVNIGIVQEQASEMIPTSSTNIGITQEQPYYLFGFEAIEKEIALIEARDNKDAFISELTKLEKERREILSDPSLERAKIAFEATPITSSEDFKAAHWDLNSSDFESTTRGALILALALVLGGMLGLFILFARMAVVSTQRKQAL